MKRCIEKQNAKHGVTQTREENKDKTDGKKIRDQDVHWRSDPLGQGESSSSEDGKDSEEEQFNLNRFTEIAGNCRRTFGGEDKQEKEKKVEQMDKGKSMVKMHNRFVARNNEDSDGGNEFIGFSKV